MKSVVSISIGSSKRDHHVELELLGQKFDVRRVSTDGDMNKAVGLIRQYDEDPGIAAIGLGGLGVQASVAGHVYAYRDGIRFQKAAQNTALVCGDGLKGQYERNTPRAIEEKTQMTLAGKKVGMVCAFDRWGLSMGFEDLGCEMTYADLPYALGIPWMIHNHKDLVNMVHLVGPIAVRLPFSILYPSTSDHTTEDKKPSALLRRFYEDNDIIAGDKKFITQYMPEDMSGKWIVTNTTTMKDVEIMRQRGVELLVTTTPRLEGRTFGTNVIEATLVALDGAAGTLPEERYVDLMNMVGWGPDFLWLQK